MLRVAPFARLAEAIRGRPPRCGPVRVVAVDGPGGAGKSVFAARLAAALGDAPTIPTDDFASWDDATGWWPRFEAEVLDAFASGAAARYRRYDWARAELGETRTVAPADVVIVEGVTSARRAGAGRLSLAVWVETARETRLARGLERDGAAMRDRWDEWMSSEDAFFAEDGARERVDLVVVGDPRITHDPETAFVVVRADPGLANELAIDVAPRRATPAARIGRGTAS